jgi:hypothetical protein
MAILYRAGNPAMLLRELAHEPRAGKGQEQRSRKSAQVEEGHPILPWLEAREIVKTVIFTAFLYFYPDAPRKAANVQILESVVAT